MPMYFRNTIQDFFYSVTDLLSQLYKSLLDQSDDGSHGE